MLIKELKVNEHNLSLDLLDRPLGAQGLPTAYYLPHKLPFHQTINRR
jgi:hypothetical protein